jgi:hypothetical protein
MSGPFKMKGSSGLGYGNQHSKGKAAAPKMYDSPAQKALVGDQNNLPEDLKAKIEASPAPMMGAIGAIAGKLMGKKDEEASGAKYASPVKKDNEKPKEKMKETRGKDGSITRSKGGKSSTYNITSKTKNKDGSTTIVRTNESGHSETSTQKPVS